MKAEMRGMRKASSWTLLWAILSFGPAEAQSFKRKLGSNKWDRVHDEIQGQKRDATACPADYQLCPKSLNGGCCPSDRACGTSSCYPITTATQAACGISGYIGCGIDEGGGCCPASYSCFENGCSPLPGVTYSETCGANSYLCPASLNYGCCKIGLACGLDNCYSTAITTFTLTETFTTTSDSLPYTITSTVITAATPQAPTAAATSSSVPSVLPKVGVSATPVPKTAASGTPTSGLTMPEIGGIIGGAVTLLLVVLIAAFLIIRRLDRAIKLSEAAKSKRTSKSSSDPSQTRRTRHSYQKNSLSSKIDIDAMSNDLFLMSPSEDSPNAGGHTSHPATVYSPELDSTEISPPIFTSPFSPRSPPPSRARSTWGYRAIPTTEAGYFDIPAHQDPALRDQNLRFGHTSPRRPSQHARNWSDASDQSQGSGGSVNIAELDAGLDGRRRKRSLQSVMQSFVLRRHSDQAVSGTNDRGLLDHIDEAREPSGDFEDVPLTQMGSARLKHGSSGSFGQLFSGPGRGGQGREQREDT